MGQIQIEAAIIALALTTIVIAFLSAVIESKKRHCREYGHQWQCSHYGFICDHCGTEAYGEK